MPRQPNRRPSIYEGADGWMHTYITVGKKPNGKLDRRHIRGRTKTEVAEKVEKLHAKLRKGHVPEIGTQPTVGSWLEHWLTTIAARKCRPSTLDGYASKIRHRLIPGLGHHRLDKLTPEHVESYFADLESEVAPKTALQIYRILSRALKVAYQRGKIPANPCGRVDPPIVPDDEIEPPTLEETKAILQAAQDRSPARWWVALGLGLRQGEVLGLKWADVDLDGEVPTLSVRKPLSRRRWQHGCTDPAECARERCKTKPCPDGCRRHKRACPPPCPPGCTRHASTCPQRKGGGLVFGDPKSRKGKRTIPLPAPLVSVLRQHRLAQQRDRDTAARWFDHDLVFCQWDGKPINPRTDWGQWKELLAAAGIDPSAYRLHDARHGAATTWLATGVEPRVAMELLGHSQISLTQRYTHVRPEYMRAAAARIGAALEQLQPDGATRRHLRAVE